MSAPRVTVLMSVHNDARFIAEATESILGQSFADFELLVIDDGSTDGSADIVGGFADPRVRIIRNDRNLGLARSLNIGLAGARGELIARQDADDVSRCERLARQVAFLDAYRDIALVGAQALARVGSGKRKPIRGWPKPTCELSIRWVLLFDNPFVHTSVMFRRQIVWGGLGGYREDFRTCQDYELWSRLAAIHRVRNLPEVLVESRQRSDSLGRRATKDDRDRVRELVVTNRRRWLDDEAMADDGVDAWMALNGPRVKRCDGHAATVAGIDARLFRRFVILNPSAAHHDEIRRARSTILARAACEGARCGARGTVRLFVYACTISPPLFVNWISRFIALWILGRVRYGRA